MNVHDRDLLEQARAFAERLLQEDPDLSAHPLLKAKVEARFRAEAETT